MRCENIAAENTHDGCFLAATYGEIDFCGGERKATEARYGHAFAIGELFSDVGTETSPN